MNNAINVASAANPEVLQALLRKEQKPFSTVPNDASAPPPIANQDPASGPRGVAKAVAVVKKAVVDAREQVNEFSTQAGVAFKKVTDKLGLTVNDVALALIEKHGLNQGLAHNISVFARELPDFSARKILPGLFVNHKTDFGWKAFWGSLVPFGLMDQACALLDTSNQRALKLQKPFGELLGVFNAEIAPHLTEALKLVLSAHKSFLQSIKAKPDDVHTFVVPVPENVHPLVKALVPLIASNSEAFERSNPPLDLYAQEAVKSLFADIVTTAISAQGGFKDNQEVRAANPIEQAMHEAGVVDNRLGVRVARSLRFVGQAVPGVYVDLAKKAGAELGFLDKLKLAFNGKKLEDEIRALTKSVTDAASKLGGVGIEALTGVATNLMETGRAQVGKMSKAVEGLAADPQVQAGINALGKRVAGKIEHDAEVQGRWFRRALNRVRRDIVGAATEPVAKEADKPGAKPSSKVAPEAAPEAKSRRSGDITGVDGSGNTSFGNGYDWNGGKEPDPDWWKKDSGSAN